MLNKYIYMVFTFDLQSRTHSVLKSDCPLMLKLAGVYSHVSVISMLAGVYNRAFH